jgi:hypothetical protein
MGADEHVYRVYLHDADVVERAPQVLHTRALRGASHCKSLGGKRDTTRLADG